MAKQSCGVRTGGKRNKTRAKFKRKGPKTTVNDVVKEFKEGDSVQVVIDSGFHAGLPDKRFHGLSGKISGKRGKSYEIELKRGNKEFTVVTTPVHIKKLNY
jgi:large subunit ribosomal protein L21e